MADLSIIIVNWNSLEFLKNCIASIEATTHDVDYEIIVVDNDSPERGCHELRVRFPDVKLIVLERNIGFGAANNVGAAQARGRDLLFLNPDTLVTENALSRMMAVLDAQEEVGAVGCRLLNGDGTLQTSCVQSFPTILNQLLAFDWLKCHWPRLPLFGIRALYTNEGRGVYEVDVVSGACIMLKRKAFEQGGGFHRDYFMYAEEVDLCYRVRNAGMNVQYVGDAQVIHFGGQSTKKKEDGFSDILMRDSVFKFLRRSRGNPYARLYRIALFLSATVRMVVLVVVFPFSAIPNRFIRRDAVKRAFKKWSNIARWSLALANRTLGAATGSGLDFAGNTRIFDSGPGSQENA
ncbi:glycosyl transferase [Edaphobacter acidisoli]|uniref:Glycosyl transferase n=1 Tax=Edaphobacter acidisoli TaxID=2040573 RepID=A0A916RKC5_9BACT|nr:glycosyltransferase family 2 protein [Edaphobacter acidisoli]GGA59948.1 glycosyl transferase [Edaphobacter acidisoli]